VVRPHGRGPGRSPADVTSGGPNGPRRLRRLVVDLVREADRDRLPGLAAEASFFAVLSLFPGLLVATSLLSLLDVLISADVAEEVQEEVVSALDTVFTDAASGAVASVEGLFVQARGELFTVAIIGALVSLSGTFAVVINALNIAYDTAERRTWIRRRLLGLVMALSTTVVAALALTVLVAGPFFGRGREIADALGFGSAFAFAWDVLRFPTLVLGLLLWAAAIFHYAPNRRTAWRSALPGAVLTTVLWLLATAGFHLYLRIAAGANPVLGAFGGGVIVMTWVYLLTLALLLGGELNATLEAARPAARHGRRHGEPAVSRWGPGQARRPGSRRASSGSAPPPRP
jgi:membrane protein